MELKYQLDGLEKLLMETVNYHASSRREIQKSIDQVELETKRIKNAFVREVFEVENERYLERYVQYHQQSIIRLIDHFQKQLEVAGIAKSVVPPYSTESYQSGLWHVVYNYLQDLLSFIENHFRQYFDQDMAIPYPYWMVVVYDMTPKLEKITPGLDLVSEEIRKLMLLPVVRVLQEDRQKDITFREIIYAKQFMQELTKIFLETEQENLEEQLWTSLLVPKL